MLTAGCERAAEQSGSMQRGRQGILIVLATADIRHPQWPGIVGGAQRYAAGVPLVELACPTPREPSPTALRDALAQTLDRNPNAVCLFVPDPAQAAPAVELLHRSHVLLITIGQPCPGSGALAHVGADLVGACELLGRNLEKVAGGARSYVLVHGNDGGSTESLTANCYRRFARAADWQTNVGLLQAMAAADSAGVTRAVETLLTRFPHTGLVVTLDSEPWLAGGASWLDRLKATNRDFQFATTATAPTLWHWLGTPARPGPAAALAGPLDGDLGFAAVETVTRAVLSPDSAVPSRTLHCELVTRETLPDFARRYTAAANGLDVSSFLPPAP